MFLTFSSLHSMSDRRRRRLSPPIIPSTPSAPSPRSPSPLPLPDSNNHNNGKIPFHRANHRHRSLRRVLACCAVGGARSHSGMAFITPSLPLRVSKPRLSPATVAVASAPGRLGNRNNRGEYIFSVSSSRNANNNNNNNNNDNDDEYRYRDIHDIVDGDQREMHARRSAILRANSKLSLAPMMDYTDRHFRHLVRLLSKKTLLYTEMVAGNAIAHERDAALSSPEGAKDSSLLDWVDHNHNFDPSYLLRFLGQGHNPEGPSVLQLGGSDPPQMKLAARTVYEFHELQQRQRQTTSQPAASSSSFPIHCDYTAINLNCGCPSPKVAGKGRFGAALMGEPHLVRDVAAALREGTEGTVPVTVKCRIGTDDDGGRADNHDSDEKEYQRLRRFVETVASGGTVTDFQIHARIAVLNKNFSPADNRKVPPLKYHLVRRLAREFPELNVSLNGGVETLQGVKRELDECPELEGVMVGRGWLSNPWGFCMADRVLYGDDDGQDDVSSSSSSLVLPLPKNRWEVLEAYGRHVDYEEQLWDPVKIRRFMTKAVSHLFAGEPNAKRYRVALDDIAGLPKKLMATDPKLLEKQPPLSELIMDAARKHLSEEVLYRTPEESWEKLVWEEEEMERKKYVVSTVVLSGSGNNAEDASNGAGASEVRRTSNSLIQEWQISRKEEEKKYCGNE
ncbi:hypothetical protein ACHAXS_002596 [Conticribra weissflogii]